MQLVNYRSAGTVEFVMDTETQEFYFLEVNTRLQVEHGVTEQVFGVDLVEWMVTLASGDWSAPTEKLDPTGHSIQVRLYAEDQLNSSSRVQACLHTLNLTRKPESKHGLKQVQRCRLL